MHNKKIPTIVGTIILVIIAITVSVFVWKYEKNNESGNVQTVQQMNKVNNSEKENKIEISDKWTLVSHDNFWNNPKLFKQPPYNFPNIEFYYPENWEFSCCNDMDFSSTHIIYSSKESNPLLPFIRISNIGLVGCPKLQNTCSIDKTIKLSADEKFNRLVSAIPEDKVLSKTELKKLNTYAFTYKKTEKNNNLSKAYLINIGTDIIEVDFANYELLDEKFIENFLNRIEFEHDIEQVSFCGKIYDSDQIIINDTNVVKIIAKITEEKTSICKRLELGKYQESGISIAQKKEFGNSFLIVFFNTGNQREEKDPFNQSPDIFKFDFDENSVFYQDQFDGKFKFLGTIK